MFESLLFLFGFIIGASAMYYYFNRVHAALEELNQKYTQLINIVSVWQKKL